MNKIVIYTVSAIVRRQHEERKRKKTVNGTHMIQINLWLIHILRTMFAPYLNRMNNSSHHFAYDRTYGPPNVRLELRDGKFHWGNGYILQHLRNI